MDRRTAQRSHILAIARRHFLARGYAATTMSAIAADVGGSKATLWNHFKSKDDLFAELVKTDTEGRSEEHTSEIQSLMRISYAVLCLKKKKHKYSHHEHMT